MALSDERIEQITGASRNRASMWLVTTAIARAIEAEVRKDDEQLIRQMLEALENHDGNYKLSKSAGEAVDAAIKAARSRLEKAP